MHARSNIFHAFALGAAAAIAAVLVLGSAPASAARFGPRYAQRNANQGSTGATTLVTGRGSSFLPKPKPLYPPGTPLIGGKPVPKRLPGIGIYVPQQLPPPPGTITGPASLGGNTTGVAGGAHWHYTPISMPRSAL